MTGRIIQFGTSRFLQAHADLFVHEARQAGQQVGPITVVQTSGAIERVGRVAAFSQPQGFPVIICGIEDGEKIERHVDVLSVDQGLSASRDWEELSALFATEADVIFSNTGDQGYELVPSDRGDALLSGSVPVSFPGKLTALLHRRWRDGARPLTFLPCELITGNGRLLSSIVLNLARGSAAPSAFAQWIEGEVKFGNTLVDRIVSQPIEPIGAIAEPYALWVIERRQGLCAPCEHPAIVLANDLEPYERLKLHILNLGHTVLADIWLSECRDPNETVRAILADGGVVGRLDDIYRREVLPGFVAHGRGEEARTYIATTLDRFLNPFLDHRLVDIAHNHTNKIERRIGAFLVWAAEAARGSAMPLLEAIVAGGGGHEAVGRSSA